MDINTSFSSSNTFLTQALNANNEKKNIQNTQEIRTPEVQNPDSKVEFEAQSFASEFGFRTDEKGIFQKDLNHAANLPLSYEINIKSVQSIAKELIKQDENLSFNKIDLPQLLNTYYSALKAVEPEFAKDDNAFLNRGEVAGLYQGFSTKSGDFSSEITRLYKGENELNLALTHNKNLIPLNLENKIINFHFDSAINNTSQNELIKPYLSKESEVSKSGLLMNFIHKDIKSANKEVNFFIEPVNLSLSLHQNFYKILQSEGSFENYVQEQNKERMSFDLYLYVNGVNKQNTQSDKLNLLYQQYLNYQKDLNIEEFTRSSSIYSLYTQALNAEFKQIKQEASTQSNQEQLNQINQTRQNSLENFYTQRQKQASLNKIVRSYMSIMS
ncbi:hypothetical protein [Campylobacter sp. MIT 97-5078]|uniref:hypothetical protein n=1 Tax=Campylobacter sp. MIT 97-5078 TaxID=1548153 RepID=UPI000513D22A|nr:hypothetical protein [Campylobacter sp. MIT 97-5078]KGI56437.1 hypothetical protein LR59_07445 [Campylobacter sp. MIT 97-5078]KGI57590.1 hypothetical protein LR59_02570 [Campylobacter sp. MIT 97-5078]KGI57712.1 hypothetical protein LR59_03240 [Campylobacter sp. MIT 97-5078]TQR26651.1 hypothetical protein DMB91_07000 [Campylobacter sp. MIT 97-5078]